MTKGPLRSCDRRAGSAGDIVRTLADGRRLVILAVVRDHPCVRSPAPNGGGHLEVADEAASARECDPVAAGNDWLVTGV